ncbi:MAG: hypothetical protein OHK0017_02810 [Patescibacteria group bacterium]
MSYGAGLVELVQDIINFKFIFSDIRAVLMVSIPVSILHYWFSRHIKHWVLVDLGIHKWLIK